MFCRKCGYKIPEGGVFCPRCGTKVSEARASQAEGALKPESTDAAAAREEQGNAAGRGEPVATAASQASGSAAGALIRPVAQSPQRKRQKSVIAIVVAAVVVIAGVGFGMAWNAGNGAKPIASNQQAAQGNSGGSGNGSAAAGQQAQQASQQARQTQPADEKAAEEARQRAEEEQARQQADQLRQEAFGSFPHDFAFASGAGGWSTDMTIQPDGTFAGQWHDSNMGESGPGYQASLYVCGFEGKFTVLEKVSDTEFLLQLDYLRPTNGSSEEIDSSGLRTVYTDDEPYGLGDMTETPVRGWHLYLPGQSTAGFSDDVKMWIFRTSSSYTDVLNMYALADDATGNGWSG